MIVFISFSTLQFTMYHLTHQDSPTPFNSQSPSQIGQKQIPNLRPPITLSFYHQKSHIL